MKIGIVLGAALALAPAMAFAQQGQTQTRTPAQTQMQTRSQSQNLNQDQSQKPDVTTQKLLPKDAKLVGTVESTDVRAFPEQMSKGQTANIEKEGLVGVGAVDRVWTTKQPYKQAVSQFDQKLKGEGIEPIAKTTTASSTAWNMRMPDGHIANVVVRNTQPTTIEAVQAAVMAGTVNEQNQNLNQNQPQRQQPSTMPKTKSNDTNY